MPGHAYFIRHGESTANERNVFAGLHDVELTPYGQLQAKRAGEDILRQNIKFDSIYVSYLRRAWQTCQIALQQSDPACKIEPVMDMRLAERSFGVFAGRNQNLLKLVYGYKEYEHLLHSPSECPPSAEQIASIYSRVSLFYTEEVLPRTARGENVLVVAHQYVIEPLALYLGNLGPEAYKPLNLPNGKALSVEMLKSYLTANTGHKAQLLHRVGQETTIYAMKVLMLAALLGMVLKLAIQRSMPTECLVALVSLMLGVCTFYTYLDVDIPYSAHKIHVRAATTITGNYLLRWVIIVALSVTKVFTPSQFLWGLLFLMPPALTCPTLSLLWGGGKYVSVIGSLLFSLILPGALIGFAYAPGVLYAAADLLMFYVVLGVGLLLPAAAAQCWRLTSPVECARYTKSYKFLSAWALWALGFLATYQYTPPHLLHDLYEPKTATAGHILQDFWRAMAVFAALRVTSWLVAKGSERHLHMLPETAMDLYVLLTTPNIFLWLGLAEGSVGHEPVTRSLEYVKFWAVLFFFCLPSFEQDMLVLHFCRSMAATTTKVNRLSLQQLQEMWDKLWGPGNDDELDWQGVKQFANAAQEVTTGRKETVHDYVVTKLFEVLDADFSGTVSKAELFTYLSNVGLVVDLNTLQSTSATGLMEASSNWWMAVMMPHSSVAKQAIKSSGTVARSQVDQLWYMALMEEQAMVDREQVQDDDMLGRFGIKAFAEQVQWAMSGQTVSLPDEVVDKLFKVLDVKGTGFVHQQECIEYLTSMGLLVTEDDGQGDQQAVLDAKV